MSPGPDRLKPKIKYGKLKQKIEDLLYVYITRKKYKLSTKQTEMWSTHLHDLTAQGRIQPFRKEKNWEGIRSNIQMDCIDRQTSVFDPSLQFPTYFQKINQTKPGNVPGAMTKFYKLFELYDDNHGYVNIK